MLFHLCQDNFQQEGTSFPDNMCQGVTATVHGAACWHPPAQHGSCHGISSTGQGIFRVSMPRCARLSSGDVSRELFGKVVPSGVCSCPHSSANALGFFSNCPPTAACHRLSLSISAVCTAWLRWVKPAGADECNSLFPFLTPRESRKPLRSFKEWMAETARITHQKNTGSFALESGGKCRDEGCLG